MELKIGTFLRAATSILAGILLELRLLNQGAVSASGWALYGPDPLPLNDAAPRAGGAAIFQLAIGGGGCWAKAT
jgi:hypothetical protein